MLFFFSILFDFKELITGGVPQNILSPLEIFEKLDKKVGKEYLRNRQIEILENWHEKFRTQKDTIIKLHTGEGKTLVGLLTLQSSINEGYGPGIYLCPDNYLVSQTVHEAKSFGIKVVTTAPNSPLPHEFISSKAILVTTCQKLFNGKSVFGVDTPNISIGTVVLDDAHKCIDIIRESFSINIKKNDHYGKKIYDELWKLFESELANQAPAIALAIKEGDRSVLAVPYWTWFEKQSQILDILNQYKATDELKFVWELIKDELEHSICIFSGGELQISPRLMPLNKIPSFIKSKRRIFLSATLMEDDVLIKDFDVSIDSINNPLTSEMRYSGERLIITPTSVSTSLDRKKMISWLNTYARKNGKFGIWSLVPSCKNSEIWKNSGSYITNGTTLSEDIESLKKDIKDNNAKKVIVLVNKYDGVDLPDDLCRILCLDAIPKYASPLYRYIELMRSDSDITRRQKAQRIEQGMGRGIRGNNDWCIIFIIEDKLTYFLSQISNHHFFSPQTKAQLELSNELINKIKTDESPLLSMVQLVEKCIDRDEGWKEFYRQRMDNFNIDSSTSNHLLSAIKEREAELHFKNREHGKALRVTQVLIDDADETDKGWYHQLFAMYAHSYNKEKSLSSQKKAHSLNNKLFRLPDGITYSCMIKSLERNNNILEWIKKHDDLNTLILDLNSILNYLEFNKDHTTFEISVEKLGIILGFTSSRPEIQTIGGSDNLWGLGNNTFMVISCKNEVRIDRTYISQREVNQLLGNIAWFDETYKSECMAVFFHPANMLDKNVNLGRTAFVIQPNELSLLKNTIFEFYQSFRDVDFDYINTTVIDKKITYHKLDVMHFREKFFRTIRNYTPPKKNNS